MREDTRAWIESIKLKIAKEIPFDGYKYTTASGLDVKLEFIGRGELAYYQEGTRALLLEVDAGRGVIFLRSIREWDTGKRVTPAEKASIIEHVSSALTEGGAAEVVLWDR